MKRPYYSWRWLMKWFAPLPVLIWYSKRHMGAGHVWYQDKDVNLEVVPRLYPEIVSMRSMRGIDLTWPKTSENSLADGVHQVETVPRNSAGN